MSDTSAVGVFDLDAGMDYPEETTGQIHDLLAILAQYEGTDASESDTEWLAKHVHALKELESVAVDARKHFESALDDRVQEGETAHGLSKQSGSRSYVTDDAAAFDAVLESGHDPRDVASVKVSDLRDVLGKDAEGLIGTTEYTYFRRQS